MLRAGCAGLLLGCSTMVACGSGEGPSSNALPGDVVAAPAAGSMGSVTSAGSGMQSSPTAGTAGVAAMAGGAGAPGAAGSPSMGGAAATAGTTGTAGVAGAMATAGMNGASGGAGGMAGAAGESAAGGTTGATGAMGGTGAAGMQAAEDLEPFSFFVTSLEIMRELSGSEDGFGGDLGGLQGADDICQQAAAAVGFGAKQWRAFLSATDGGDGQPVHAIDRVGEGPWYDRNGRLIAEDKAGLLTDRPSGDPLAVNDLPNEFGEGLQQMGDTHDVMTGTNAQGQLDSTDPANTCNDWTSTTVTPTGGGFGGGGGPGGGGPGGRQGGLRLGHSWPARSGTSWMAVHPASSCAAGVNLLQDGAGDGSSVGSGGGWGAIYCFALTP